MRKLLPLLLAVSAGIALGFLGPSRCPALEISPDAYKPIQWVPPPGTYMPIPPNPCDYYCQWRRAGGRSVYPPSPISRWCRDMRTGRLVRC